jgi:hypothetical protein
MDPCFASFAFIAADVRGKVCCARDVGEDGRSCTWNVQGNKGGTVAPTTKSKQPALEEVHQQLVLAVEQLVTSDDWLAFLAMASRFHRYSLNNVLLIMRQAPEATQVASYTTWQSLGRQVRKGEKGIKILAPCRYRTTAEEATATGRPVGEYAVRGFRVASVFDVSQTDGDALPSVDAPVLLEGDAPLGMWTTLTDLLVKDGYTVTRGDVGEANGETRFSTKEVIVAPHLSDRAAAKTLAHELAHVRSEHGDNLTSRPREVLEVEAESCAFMVCHAWGINSAQYSIPYVAYWAQEAGMVKETMHRVVATARKIIEDCQLD